MEVESDEGDYLPNAQTVTSNISAPSLPGDVSLRGCQNGESFVQDGEPFTQSSFNSLLSNGEASQGYDNDSMFLLPPSKAAVLSSMEKFGFKSVVYPLPRFSAEKDQPDRLLNIRADTIESIDPFPGLHHLDMVRQDKITQTFGRYGGGDVVQQPLQVNPETPGGADKVSVASLASRRKTRVQTIGRPPTRAQVEDWIRVRAAFAKLRAKKAAAASIEDPPPKSRKPKILIRENSDDSEGSEISCSPPSSPSASDAAALKSRRTTESYPPSSAETSSLSLPEMSQGTPASKSPQRTVDITGEEADLIKRKLSGDSGSKHEEDEADDEGEDGANVREGDVVDDKDGVRSISPILKPVVARKEEESEDEIGESPIITSQRSRISQAIKRPRIDLVEESPIIRRSQQTQSPSQRADLNQLHFLDMSDSTTSETSFNKPEGSQDPSIEYLKKDQNSSRHSSGDIFEVSSETEKNVEDANKVGSRNPSSDDMFAEQGKSPEEGSRPRDSPADKFDNLEAREKETENQQSPVGGESVPEDGSEPTAVIDMQNTSSETARGVISEKTPILKRDRKSKKVLKRRISWDLPQSDQQSNEESLNQEKPKAGDIQDDSRLESQSISSPASLSKSIMDKLNNTQAIKKYLTPTGNAKESRSMVESPTVAGTPKPLVDLKNTAGAARKDLMSMLLMEVFVTTRQHNIPDPLLDPIQAVFYSVVKPERTVPGCICVSPGKEDIFRLAGVTADRVRYVETEIDLFKNVVRLVRDADPDILLGYEIQLESWGLLFERGFHLGINLCPAISRVPASVRESKMVVDENNPGAQYNADHTSEINLVGRVVFNTWRMLRSELAVTSYTLENIAMKVLNKRIARISHQSLTTWWRKHTTRHKTINYLVERNKIHLEILTRLDLISRTSELARLFGIQFSEVLSRGSQFRVESSMLRLAKPRNFLPVSPSRTQLANQAAPEYLALLLEPESRLYTDPVIVLDFQSLYPSIIIGYNYCYSTCLGRIQNMSETGNFTFGCTQLEMSTPRLAALRDHITISPGGVVFAKPNIRKGVLPHMLEDILNTRIMVKQSMKKHAKDPDLQKILHARQLGLKLIANVTYGYTSANFSGRMPCIEVGDSVVAKGREALELAIKTIEETPAWGAKVVYGDTDSVFVLLKGKTKEEAFNIGEEMAKVITQQNPKPMKLKFEKVYLPCILQTKKRYVGYMYESRSQVKPVFDAKGIETVRRDGIPATSKMLEKAIRILFESNDVSQVKSYVQSQFRKIISGSLSLQDLTFAKEFRGFGGYRPTACVPALELTKLAMRRDRRLVPRTGERVPYVVVYGEPGLPLIQLVREPMEVLENPSLRPNAHYYITKVIIPPLNRCFLLLGVDTGNWYAELPRVAKPLNNSITNKKGVISKYFVSQSCLSCGKFTTESVCEACKSVPDVTSLMLSSKAALIHKDIETRLRECVQCSGETGRECISLDCPNIYRRVAAINSKDDIGPLLDILDQMEMRL